MPDVKWNKKKWTENAEWFLDKKQEEFGHYGNHWGNPEEKAHLMKFRDTFLIPNVNDSIVALEIGCGGGRWTQYLKASKKLYALDVNEIMLKLCKKRFKDEENITFVQTNGTDFPAVEENSLDLVFSHDVFVHIDPLDVFYYLKSIKKALKPTGKAVLHFADQNKVGAQKNVGFARNNPDLMRCLVVQNGFKILREDEELFKHSAVFEFEHA